MSNNLIDELRLSWYKLLENMQLDLSLGDKIFISLIDRYSEQNRAYHNLDHIYGVLESLGKPKHNLKNMNILQISAWFHDYIYEPTESDNERKSALDAAKILGQLNVDTQIVKTVTQIILSTKIHKPLIEDVNNLFFLDADLAILGTAFSTYKKYAQAIRQEYKHLSDHDYKLGRKKVLAQFLKRNKIYYTDYFYRHLELNARVNMQKEIKKLNSNSVI